MGEVLTDMSNEKSTMRCLGLRYDTPTYKDINARKEREYRTKGVTKAYCTSHGCTGDPRGLSAIEKDVSVGTFECPDCGYALFWGNLRICGLNEIAKKIEKRKKAEAG